MPSLVMPFIFCCDNDLMLNHVLIRLNDLKLMYGPPRSF